MFRARHALHDEAMSAMGARLEGARAVALDPLRSRLLRALEQNEENRAYYP